MLRPMIFTENIRQRETYFFTKIRPFQIDDAIKIYMRFASFLKNFCLTSFRMLKKVVELKGDIFQLAQWLGARLAFNRREFDPSLSQSLNFQKGSDSNVTQLFRTPMALCSLQYWSKSVPVP